MDETKLIAKQLGLLKKRSKVPQTGCIKEIKRNRQEFAYLIVIDFESTCWKDVKNRGQEIIEFPAVLLNTWNGEIEGEFHHYVQPYENPVLSEFCKQLTGITQKDVEDGIPISICLSQFRHWLRKMSTEKQFVYNKQQHSDEVKPLCTFVTWSDWDLAVCLQYECRRKQLRVPNELSSWIDLRATYRKFYGRKPQGLNGALQDLGIFFEGREHSGLDDARNTAKLAWRMMQDGCIMKITKSRTQDLRTTPSAGSTSAPLRQTVVNQPASTIRPSSSEPKSTSTAMSSLTTETKMRSDSNQQRSSIRARNFVNLSSSITVKNFQIYDESAGSNGNSGGAVQIQSRVMSGIGVCSALKRKPKFVSRLQDVTNIKVAKLSTSPIKVVKRALQRVKAFAMKRRNTKGNRISPSKDLIATNGETARSRQISAEDIVRDTEMISKMSNVSGMKNIITCQTTNMVTSVSYPNGKVFKVHGNSETVLPTTNAILSNKNKETYSKTEQNKQSPWSNAFKTPLADSGNASNKFKTPGSADSITFNKIQQENSCKKSVNHFFQSPVLIQRKGDCTLSNAGKGYLDENASSAGKTNCRKFISDKSRILGVANKNQQYSALKMPNTVRSITLTTNGTSLQTPSNFVTPRGSSVLSSVTEDSNDKKSPISLSNASSFSSNCVTPNSGVSLSTPYSNPCNNALGHSTRLGVKITPPLCSCGRRSVRKCVQSPGPNVGRYFFTCPNGKSNNTYSIGAIEKKKRGCKFFKWL